MVTKGGIQGSNISRHSSHATAADEILNQRLSAENMEGGVATLLVSNGATINVDNKHRSQTVTFLLRLERLPVGNNCNKKKITIVNIRFSVRIIVSLDYSH